MRSSIVAGILLAGSSCLPGCGTQPPFQTADLMIVNARVYSLAWGDPAPDGTPAPDAPYGASGWHPDAEAVAVRGGKIVYVGGQATARTFVGEGTRVIDVGGATVLPGLVDSHVHVAELGQARSQVDLTGVATEEEGVRRVAAHARSAPAGSWILGRGWDEGAWANRYPTADGLSRTVPDHPVVLHGLHGFAVWANGLAMQKAGITRDTPDPDGGEILRDARGNPTGVFLNRASTLLDAAVPPPTDEEYAAIVRAGLEEMARSGYVAVHEAGADSRHMAAFETLAATGDLPIRVYAMLSARDEPLCRRWIARGRDTDPSDGLTVSAVKAYYDGALGSRGARLLEDYSDRPGHRGVSGGLYGFDQALVAEMMRAGFQVGIHAIGDAGNRETLDFLQGVIAGSPAVRNGRHRIEHAQVIHPDDIPRFAASDIVASMEPPHAVEDKAWAEDRLGPERIRGAYAWRTLRRSGATLIFNSDLTGSDHAIGYGLHAAITRRDKALQPPGGWYPDERLTPEEALRAYTVWPAWVAGWEDRTGSLAVGRDADITVLDVDPFDLGDRQERLLGTRVLLTVVGGKVVYEGDRASPITSGGAADR